MEELNCLVAACSPRYNRCELYAMDADGSNPLRLTHNQVCDDAPTWTPGTDRSYFPGMSAATSTSIY